MAESRTSQTIIGFSTAPEASYGTNPVTAANFTPMVTRVTDFPLTDSEKLDDRGIIGRSDSANPSFQRSGFRIPTAIELSDVVNASTLHPLLRRFAGKPGAAPTVVEAAIAFKHTLSPADPNVEGLQLPATSMIFQNNEFDYIHRGCVGSTLQLAQNGTADPTYTLSLVGAGVARRIAIDYPAFGTLAVPPQDKYMYGASSAIQYTDDLLATISLTTPTHKARSVTFSTNNNLDTGDTRMGMPQADVNEPKRGWYRDFLHMGDPEVSAEFTMGMDSDYSLKDAEELNTIYTNFTWTMSGDIIPGTASANKYFVKVVIPKFNLRSPRAGDENAKKTKGFTVFPIIHGGGYGLYRFEVQNGSSGTIN